MACSSAAAKFTVRKRPEVLVAPAAPTPRELKRLSDFDALDSLRIQIPSSSSTRGTSPWAARTPCGLYGRLLPKP
ncbi:benzyl alcohol O-benzoyltransferase-like [Panicum miliaceum]|uniref:Benzyl alcohol O-benzoyltransferase-like n=1 Tax=Panicum miliaceum TaxID=4540 RepID=A0A3L6PMJ6_PANMI|nr:benzyl alcohol O-benzoyltransferase-like [Panicum miliaceum]